MKYNLHVCTWQCVRATEYSNRPIAAASYQVQETGWP